MVVALAAFGISLLGIIALFALKHREMITGSVIAPHAREVADAYALQCKAEVMRLRVNIEKLPPLAAMLGRSAVREGALMFASFARQSERQAHRLADVVSYKHRFERRAPRSEFLRQVSERGAGTPVSSRSPEDQDQSTT